MIKWEKIHQLHGINRLREIACKWHGMEIFWSDFYGNIKTEKSTFLESSRRELFLNEIKGRTGELKNSHKTVAVFDSKILNSKIIALKLIYDGEYLGTIWGGGLPNRKMTGNMEYLVELIAVARDEIVQYSREIAKKEEYIYTLSKEIKNRYRYQAMIGKSQKMQEIYSLLDKISDSEASVFIQGASGTGKELMAKAAHYCSPRKDNIFLAINCSAFNGNFLDSELFGQARGAVGVKKGLFEQADGGTLFLDEVGDISLSMQVKLLRLVLEGTYLPVGASSPQKCDVRVIASTNKSIEKMVAEGKFREDLYYRLNVININVPPLKERMEDIPLLIDHFMDQKCKELGVARKTLSQDVMEKFFDYHWPGNVRELQNEMERLIVLAGDKQVISLDIMNPRMLKIPTSSSGKEGGLEFKTTGKLKDVVETIERQMIKEGLRRCFFNKSRLARELGISRANLISKVYKYGLERRERAAA